MIRNDLSVDWSSSPRIITVAAPSTEITMQDLLDTLRSMESLVSSMDDDSIVDASGKENLGGGTKVGLTVTLLNAKIAFQARPGPSWVLCSLSGGNLVAVDANRVDMDVRQPTAFVTVDRVSSASATLQEQDALQYSSYQNRVWVDVLNGEPGTEYPIGTRERPVNNIPNARTIVLSKGFDTLGIIGNLVLSTGDNVSNLILEGRSPALTVIIIETGAVCVNTEVRTAYIINSVLDGNSIFRECAVENLVYLEGYLYTCVLRGTIALSGTMDSYFIDCVSGAAQASMSDVPVVDMGGSGRNLVVRNFSGPIKIANLTGDNKAVIDFISGHLDIDSTVTGGTIVGRGAFTLDNSAAGGTVDVTGQVNTYRLGVRRGLVRTLSVGLTASGLVVSGVVSKDQGAFTTLTNPVVAKTNQQYAISLTAQETDAADIYILLTATGMIPVPLTIQTIE